MTARPGTVSSSVFDWRLTLRRVLVLAIPLGLLATACTSDSQDVVADGTETPTVEEAPATTAPADSPTVAASTSEATAAPVSESLPCEDVPAFSAADTVSIACSWQFAVSPELFAGNAGWHLFEAQEGTWVEIDYARTCCEPDGPTFTQLLGRNGLNQAMLTDLCAASGLGTDPSTGCVAVGQDEETADGNDEAAFDGTWLRVNGLGPNDFDADQDVVLSSIEGVFGPAVSIDLVSECGAGPMAIASFDDFTVQFQDDVLIGWFYESSTPVLTTPSGVMVGISEADLAVVYEGVEINDDTLGREFFFEVPAGFMAGFISDADATVTALYAGTTCFFR